MRRLLLLVMLACAGLIPPANANPGATVETTGTPMRLTAIHKADMLYVQAMTRIARAIEETTGKQIRPELLTNGKKGSEEETLKEQMQGNLEGGFTSALTLAHHLPAFRVLGMPLLFTKPEQVRAFVGSPLDAALRANAKTANLKILGMASYGFYGILSLRPGENGAPPTLNNLPVRIPQEPWLHTLHQALPIKPFMIPGPDLPQAISSGLIQGVAASPEMLSRTALPTTAAVYFDTRHLHGWSLFTVNLAWFEKLSPDLQTAIENAVNTVLPQTLEQAFALELKLLNKWSFEHHLQIVTPPAGETTARLQELARQTAQEMETTLNLPGQITRLWTQNQQPASPPAPSITKKPAPALQPANPPRKSP